MKELILYYSYTGHTKQHVEALAKETGADTLAVLDQKRPNVAAAYTAGCVRARSGSSTLIQPISTDWTAYDKVVLAAPIWASYPAPAINSAADLLPSGMHVDLLLVAASGGGKDDKLRAKLEGRGCIVGETKYIRG